LSLGSLIAALLLSATSASAEMPVRTVNFADAAFVELESKACEPSGDERVLPRDLAIAQLLSRYPVTLDVSFMGPQSVPLGERIATTICDGASCQPAEASLAQLRNAAARMLSVREGRGMKLEWKANWPEPEGDIARIAAFYDPNNPGYVLTCTAPPAPVVAEVTPPVVTEKTLPAIQEKRSFLSLFRVASNVSQTEKDKYSQRDPARISYYKSASDKSAIVNIRAAIAAPDIAQWGDDADATKTSGNVRPFVAYERVTHWNQYSEVNNLDFGIRSRFRFADDEAEHAYIGNLTAAWQTDDEFQSALTRFEASLKPPVQYWLYGDSDPKREYCVWCQNANMTIVADYVGIDDPGDKVTLNNVKQYGRLGYDMEWGVRLKRPAGLPTFGMNVQYSAREDVTSNRASADRLGARAMYYPTDTSHFAFGLEYDRGKDLTSLVELDRWMITWGYRQ
jgi:hypothetical protein